LKPEWWGSPLAQGEKYQGRKKPVTRNDDDDNDNNNDNNDDNNNNITIIITTTVVHSTTSRQPRPYRKELKTDRLPGASSIS
jgi:hypothetical protein